MENIEVNRLLDRDKIKNDFINYLNINKNKNLLNKNGIFVHGKNGVGKTTFVNNILNSENYDVIHYDITEVKSKLLENIDIYNETKNNSIVNFFSQRKHRKSVAIVIDDIDYLNSSEKGYLSILIKLLRPKKTKKQKNELSVNIPIICVATNTLEKKIKELMKITNEIYIPQPSDNQIKDILSANGDLCNNYLNKFTEYIQQDLHKLDYILKIMKTDIELIKNNIDQSFLQKKKYNSDTKQITETLLNNPYNLKDHDDFMNETDRTIVSLLWHENLPDVFSENNSKKDIIKIYNKILKNICMGDYIDRITFQNQLWQFNEMTSLIKVFKNNMILYNNKNIIKKKVSNARFTKILTKYSTEYNNSVFNQSLCYKLLLDNSDVNYFFDSIKKENVVDNYIDSLNDLNIYKLDINRILRYYLNYCQEYKEPKNVELLWDDLSDCDDFDNNNI